eukprot:TRINITY_DN76419_c0_g1_i1.p1 TRINITY_DN76419_c0_g1~~TRINITY_DN76419_c0_g1_i1.p1  ORF type:complete len:406 (-),score=60.59 TRINITY_DN76419_c0_g1_i1:522-1739(-)
MADVVNPVPQFLHVATKQPLCTGIYCLSDQTRSRLPVWTLSVSEAGRNSAGVPKILKQSAKDRALFAAEGQWRIGNADDLKKKDKTEAEEGTPKTPIAWLKHPGKHEGEMPQGMTPGRWQIQEDMGWRNEPSTTITEVPRQILVKVPAYLGPEHSGVYNLDADCKAYPKWRRSKDQVTAEIFRDLTTSVWHLRVGSSDSTDEAVSEQVESVLTGRQKKLDEIAETHTAIRAIPSRLCVSWPDHAKGDYWLSPLVGNDMPLWKNSDKDRILYAGSNEKWIIGDQEEEKLQFDCKSGLVRCPDEHNGRLPHEITGCFWQFSDGTDWRPSPAIRVELPKPVGTEKVAEPPKTPYWAMLSGYALVTTKAAENWWSEKPLNTEMKLQYGLFLLWPLLCVGVWYFHRHARK